MKVKVLNQVNNGPAPGKIVTVREINNLFFGKYQITEDGPYLGVRLFALDATPVEDLPASTSINDLVRDAHQNAISKGWWEPDADGTNRSFGECIALVHSELSEALEFFRNGEKPNTLFYSGKNADAYEIYSPEKDSICQKPDGIPAELADVVIRVFDIAGRWNIDLETAIREKMAYNATRPRRHGGKVL